MTKVKEKESQLVLIEKAAEYFESDLQPKYDLDLKFVIFKEKAEGELKILLMETFHPFDYHPEALLFHMQTNKLKSVITNGAGKVVFDTENHAIIFSGYSKSFGYFCPGDVLAVAQPLWPDFKIVFMNMPGSSDEMAVSGTWYSIEEIGYYARR